MKKRWVVGYTLIEVVIAVSIGLLVTGLGLAAYNRFNERQGLEAGGSQLYSDLRLAQSRAAASDKPVACASGTLQGYRLLYLTGSTTKYQVMALCDGELVDVGIIRTLPRGVETESGVGAHCDNEATFYILGKGAVGGDFCIKGFGGRYYKVSVSDSGEIVDLGEVTEAEIFAPTDCRGYCKYQDTLYKDGTCRNKPNNCRSNEVYEAGGVCSGGKACCCKKK